jgi:alkylation response protein AidB-like acyl-CoA dehydrogenase
MPLAGDDPVASTAVVRRNSRMSVLYPIFGGTTEIQKEIIARGLGL